MNKPGRIHRAWWMLIGCCLLQGGSLGIIHNCRGIFYDPVIEDLGFGMGAFSFYILFFGVCSCFVLPFVGKLFRRIDSRILLGGASLVFSGTVFVMGFFQTDAARFLYRRGHSGLCRRVSHVLPCAVHSRQLVP